MPQTRGLLATREIFVRNRLKQQTAFARCNWNSLRQHWPAIAAGDTTDFGVWRNLYFAAGAAPLIAERLMRAWRLRRAQAFARKPPQQHFLSQNSR